MEGGKSFKLSLVTFLGFLKISFPYWYKNISDIIFYVYIYYRQTIDTHILFWLVDQQQTMSDFNGRVNERLSNTELHRKILILPEWKCTVIISHSQCFFILIHRFEAGDLHHHRNKMKATLHCNYCDMGWTWSEFSTSQGFLPYMPHKQQLPN